MLETRKYRKVEIAGEVYFEVAKNSIITFIVKVNNSEIGLYFNFILYKRFDYAI